MMNARAHLILSVALLTSFAGCGGGGAPDQPDLGALTGTIKVDGAAKQGLEVSFQPESGRPSMATTDANGYYEMQYTANAAGAKIGKGVVRVTSGSDGGSESYGSEDESEEGDGEGESYGSEKEAIPAKYNSEAADNPEMNIEVEAGGTTFDLDIVTSS